MTASVLAWSLLHFLWQGAVIAAVVAAAMGSISSAQRRYLIGCAGLAAMALSPLLTAAWLARLASPPALPAPAALEPSAFPAELIVAAWVLGVSASLLRLGGEALLVRRVRRAAIAAPPLLQATADRLAARLGLGPIAVRLSPAAIGPMAVGLLRPAVLLPASLLVGLSPAQLEALLAHELAHIRRWDLVAGLLQALVESVLFYHPAVWWLSQRVRADRELCCDELAVQLCGDRILYARTLADLEAHRAAQWRLAAAAHGGSLMSRIKHIVGQPTPRRTRWSVPVLLLAVTFASTAVGSTVIRPEALALADEAPSSAADRIVISAPSIGDLDNEVIIVEQSQRVIVIEQADAPDDQRVIIVERSAEPAAPQVESFAPVAPAAPPAPSVQLRVRAPAAPPAPPAATDERLSRRQQRRIRRAEQDMAQAAEEMARLSEAMVRMEEVEREQAVALEAMEIELAAELERAHALQAQALEELERHLEAMEGLQIELHTP